LISRCPLSKVITHPQKKLQHLAGRYLLPYLFPGFPNSEIEVADTRKPFLPGEQYHFSISHCSKYAAAIVSSSKRVGIDVELVTPRLHNIKKKFLHHTELGFVQSLPEACQLDMLSILWSVKEAMFKWYGEGEVDFSEMLRTRSFELQEEGQVYATFIKKPLEHELVLHYKLMEGLTLVWLATNPGQENS
jgi:phosphopantetheinyl transferase